MLAAVRQEKPFINIEGRRRRMSKYSYNVFCILTLGVGYMACRYIPRLKLFLVSYPCSLSEADCVVVTSQNGRKEFIDVTTYDSVDALSLKRYTQEGRARVIDSQFSRLVYDFTLRRFVVPPVQKMPSKGFDELYSSEVSKSPEMWRVELMQRRIFYGRNVTQLPIPGVAEIVVRNILSATFLSNVVCLFVWVAIDYTKYALAMGILMGYSTVFTIWEEVLHNMGLRRLWGQKTVRILQNGRFVDVDSREVYPGNMIYIEPCKNFPCDAVVVKGDAITNECLLTGETVPIYKSADKVSIVYSGTDVLKSINTNPIPREMKNEHLCRVRNLARRRRPQTVEAVGGVSKLENFAVGVVVKTGLQTARGQILRNMFNPKPVYNRFVWEAERVIWGMAGVAVCVGVVMGYVFSRMNLTGRENVVYSLDLFFTLANPALPTYLRLGTQLCYRRLVEKNIHCNNLNKMHLAGRIDTAVFDKTGTLTCEGLDLLCIDDLQKPTDDIGDISTITRMGLSTCHLVYELDGKYSGDTLDVKMFIFSSSRLVQHADNTRSVVMGRHNRIYGPILKEYNDSEEMVYYEKRCGRNEGVPVGTGMDDECSEAAVVVEIGGSSPRYSSEEEQVEKSITIVRTYEFDSAIRRMSVVADDGNRRYVFTKGSPEEMKGILKEIPREYEERTREYSLDGYRVVSLAYKEISSSVDRETDERGLTFLALIVFSNRLKPDSRETIEELNRANIRSMMCTGDNILTAISVGRECGIVEEFMPVIFPVVEENAKSVFDVDWLCIGDEEEFMFDKVKLSLYRGNDRVSQNEFVVACEGKEFDFFRNTQYFPFILSKGVVFARFNPGQKKALIENLRANGRITMFCGDGANDSGALSSADVGLALAQNEASLAANFTSTEIRSVLDLITEGRSAFVTSVATFKYVVSSCMIAYLGLLFLVLRKNFLSDLQTMHSDLFVMLPTAYFLTSFRASDRLCPRRPNTFLLSKKDFAPLCATVFMEGVVVLALSRCGEASAELCDRSTGSGLVFFAVTFMYILNGLYLSDCSPHRQSTRSNTLFKTVILLMILSTLGLLATVHLFPRWTASRLSAYRFVSVSRRDVWWLTMSVFFVVLAVFVVQPTIYSVIRRRSMKEGVDEIDGMKDGEW